MGNLFTDLFSTQPAQQAAQAQITGYNNANSQANATLTGAQQNADNLYGNASQLYQPLLSSTGAGSAAYGDATGANGAAGLARARANYQADPGYNGGLTTGIDQVMRTAAAAGNLGGGNTSADEIKFASDYDNQKYSNYVASLAPYLGANNSAVSGAAGLKTGQAALDTGIAGQQAQNNWNTQTGIGNANANAALSAYGASGNFWSALGGAAKLGLGAMAGGAFPTSFSGPSFGGGSALTGDAYGGSSSNPLPGLSANDYGVGF